MNEERCKMALDSQEMSEFVAGLAVKHGLDAVILRPDVKTAWEYNKEGKIVKRDVSPLVVTDKGRRAYCVPIEDSEEGFWKCGVYTEANVALSHFDEQFPN
jgi:hypothetical protein